MMKKNYSLLLLFVTQVNHASTQSKVCIQVSEYSNGEQQRHNLLVENETLYICSDKNRIASKYCTVLFAKAPKQNTYTDDEHWANTFYNAMKNINKLGMKFDRDNLAYDYAHSLNNVVTIAQNEGQQSLNFHRNQIFIDFSKFKNRYDVGAYPRGILIPTSSMFILEKISNATIKKTKGKVSEVEITTNNNQSFKYNLYYDNKSRLTKSKISFRKNFQSSWIVDTIKDYRYSQCPP